MNRKLKTVLCAALVLLLMFSCCCVSFADEPMPVTVKAKAAVLMDVDSGKVLMSMNADEKLYPASVTKIMTLLLVTEALDSGKISLSDTVTASASAASKGGSQIWLKEGEQMTVDDLLKATAVYSANDACTALGELLAGSDEAFTAMINERAQQLGMKNTHFDNIHLSRLTFLGEYLAMDFNATLEANVSLIVFDHCYGYPLSGEFIRIDHCYDIPRITHCHVNPAMRRQFQGDCTPAVIDAVIAKGSYAYAIDHTDNAQLMDIFTFGTYGGIRLGEETYGQLTNFNFDCVVTGILKQGRQPVNRNWQIAQGSIISNAGSDVRILHPIIVEGEGHTSLTNVEIFSGYNPALTCVPELQSWDYLLVRGDRRLSVTMTGCRLTKYAARNPITIENPHALVQAIGCVDKDQNPLNLTINGKY